MEQDYDLIDDLDYTAHVIDEVSVDNSDDVISEPEEEYSESFSDYLTEEPVAVTAPPVSMFSETTKQESAFQTLQTLTPPASASTAIATAAVAKATATSPAIKTEEKKPIYKNPLVIGAGILALYFMMNSDD